MNEHLAIYKGKCDIIRIRRIQSLTMKDSKDRLYYRMGIMGPWIRLRGSYHYKQLNKAIDR